MRKMFLFLASILTFAAVSNAQGVSDIRQVDFMNFTFQIEENQIAMKDGLQENSCQERDEDGVPMGDSWNVSTETIAYGDVDGDGKEEAIIPMVSNVCGGNMITNEMVVVYTAKGGGLAALPSFAYYDGGCPAGVECNFTRAPGVLVRFDAKAKAIVVENTFATGDDATCCPSLGRETWFKWNGAGFAELKKGKLFKRQTEN